MIEIINVNFRYAGPEPAGVKDINLCIPDGECLLLCGASGCGKTTITRLINGLIPHFYKGELSGEVMVNGKKISKQQLYDLAQVVGSVFQNPRSQFFSVDTDGEIVFGPENIGLPKNEILKRKDLVLTELNLRGLMQRSLFDLSGGEKQKIACGSVAALLPDIILLDEPSSNLDWNSIKDLANVIRLWKSQGKTVIISEHRLWYLADLIDRAVYMEGGRIAKEWDRDSFLKLTETELASFELRPMTLEEKYIREFNDNGGKKPPIAENQEHSNSSDIQIRNFYFTYTPEKYLFFRKKLTPKTYCTASQVEIAKKTMKIIMSDLSVRFTARDLAKDFGISETSLKNYFRSVYGCGYAEHQQIARMKKAARLLEDTEDKVSEIGQAVGFATQAKFGAAFKECFGVTPLEYRRRSRLGEL